MTLKNLGGGGASVVLHEPQTSATPEQACVFYDGNRILGGWIRLR